VAALESGVVASAALAGAAVSAAPGVGVAAVCAKAAPAGRMANAVARNRVFDFMSSLL
jgi:hypothetical protein